MGFEPTTLRKIEKSLVKSSVKGTFCKKVPPPGIEPRPPVQEADALPLDQGDHITYISNVLDVIIYSQKWIFLQI